MPQFAGVDPALIALNPERLQSGALSSLQIADSVNRINAFKALQAEIAATRQARIDAGNANNALRTSTDTAALRNVQPLASLTGATAESGLARLPAAEKADVAHNLVTASEAQIPLGTIESRIQTAKTVAAGEAQRAPGAQDILYYNQQTEEQIAEINNKFKGTVADLTLQKTMKDLREEIDNSDNSKGEIDKALKKSETKLNDEKAKFESERQSIAAAHDAARLASVQAAHNQSNDLHKAAATMASNIQNELVRLGNVEVENPDPNTKDDKPDIKLSELIDRSYDEVDGKLVPKTKGWLFKKNAVISSRTQQLVNLYSAKLTQAGEAIGIQNEQIARMRSLQPSSTQTTFATVAEAEAAGKAGKLKDGTKVIVNGKSYTWKN